MKLSIDVQNGVTQPVSEEPYDEVNIHKTNFTMQYFKQDELNKLSARTLPIKGGDGRTPETAYQLREIKQFDAPSVEHLIIDLTLKASGFLFWHLENQTFTILDGREMDLMKVNAVKNGEAKEFSFYFDLTELK